MKPVKKLTRLTSLMVALVVGISLAMPASAASGTDMLHTFENLPKSAIKVFYPGSSSGWEYKIDTDHPSTGKGNAHSMRVDMDLGKGEGWAVFRAMMEDPYVIRDNMKKGSGDAKITFYAKATKKRSFTIRCVVKDECWNFKLDFTPGWKKYEIKFNDCKPENLSHKDKNLYQMVQSGAYNELYFSQMQVLASAGDTNGDGVKNGNMKGESFWIDNVAVSGDQVVDKASDYGLDSDDKGIVTPPTDPPGDKPGTPPTTPPTRQPGTPPTKTPPTTHSKDNGSSGGASTTTGGTTATTLSPAQAAEVFVKLLADNTQKINNGDSEALTAVATAWKYLTQEQQGLAEASIKIVDQKKAFALVKEASVGITTTTQEVTTTTAGVTDPTMDNSGDSSTAPADKPGEDGGIGGGMIALIIILCVAVLGGGGAAVYFFVIKKKRTV